MIDEDPYLGDPNDPQTLPVESFTKTLDIIIREAIDQVLLNTHTWMPGKITKVVSNGFVDVQPLLKRKYFDGKIVDLPILQGIMVSQPSGADYWIKLPVAVGDEGVILFCERSLDTWTVAGGAVDPKDIRHHDLSDAVFIPGLRPQSKVLPGALTDLVIHNGSAQLTLQKNGKFKFSNDTNEYLSVVSDLIQALEDALVLTSIGPQPFVGSTLSTLAALKVKIDDLKG